MFTGIIEETGIIKSFAKDTKGATICIECTTVLENSKIGDSISVDGVCQTAVAYSKNCFTARVSEETLAVTTFENLKTGDVVNLERALTLSSRLGGHIVTGHVDCCGKLVAKEKKNDFYDLYFEIPTEQEKYVVKKGSITINGISLTVAELQENVVTVAVIPHTFENTNLKELNIGDFVNIETDILGKYVEKILFAKDNNTGISMKFLQENGFV